MIFAGVIGGAPAGWTPAELFTGSEVGAWYDPSDLSTLWQDTAGTTPVTTTGQSVARMDDKSGNGFHMLQATGGSRPTYEIGLDGNRYLSFNAGPYMDASFGTTFAQPNYICTAFRFIDTTTNANVVFHGISGSARNALQKPGSGSTSYSMFAGGTARTFGTVDLTNHVATTVFDGASSTARVDGTGYTLAGSPGTEGLTGLRIGRNSGGTDGSRLALYGLVILDATWGSALADLETYMGNKVDLSL